MALIREPINENEINKQEICPCNPKKQILYGLCCKPRGMIAWHKDVSSGEVYRSVICKHPMTVKTVIAYKKRRDKLHGTDPNGHFFLNTDGSPITVNQIKEMKLNLLHPLLSLKIIDPCYFYCSINVDFFVNHWRYILSKKERKIRKKEWNDAVNEYMKIRDKSNYLEIRTDVRSSKQIKLLNKIGRYGTLERQKCLNCKKTEKTECQYKICRNCEIGKYCSKHCQKRHWKMHKIECKNGTVKHQFVGGNVMETVISQICQS